MHKWVVECRKHSFVLPVLPSTMFYFNCVFSTLSLHAGSSDFWVHSQTPEQYSPANSSTAKFVGGSGYKVSYGDLSYIEVYFSALPSYFTSQIKSPILSL